MTNKEVKTLTLLLIPKLINEDKCNLKGFTQTCKFDQHVESF